MNKKPRQKIVTKTEYNSAHLSPPTKSDLLQESEAYDPANYDPLKNMEEKEVILNKKKTDVITLRLSSYENQRISELADENGLSKSAFIRMVVKKALKEHEVH